jgi:chlorite dismutase
MARIRWDKLPEDAAARVAVLIAGLESSNSAVFSMLGHKGDLLFVHFRKSIDELNAVDTQVAKALAGIADIVNSYVSVVELGLYESTVKLYEALTARGLTPHTPEWNAEIEETLKRQRAAMHVRLFPEIPPSRYVCFYPMNRHRGEHKNWYALPIQDRQRQMSDHGEIGRRYAGTVRQIISGSIGFDDWEWGVDLFSDTPLVFKQLIYEMRFDEASVWYGEFGAFFVGVRMRPEESAGYFGE